MSAKRMLLYIRQEMIKIVLADDHHFVRNGIRQFIAEDPEIEVVAEAANGAQVLDALKRHPGVGVVLADLNMPVMDGYELLAVLNLQFPRLKVIFLSMVDDHNTIAELMANGASGYLFKSSEAAELTFAIKFVSLGGNYLCSELGTALLKTVRKNNTTRGLKDKSAFSEREIELLQLIAEGFTNSEIADKLFVSKRTVEGNRQTLLEKTCSRNTAMLIRNAAVAGLI